MKRHSLALLICVLLAIIGIAGARGQGLLGGLAVRPTNPVTSRAFISIQPLIPGKDAEIAVEIVVNSRYHIQSAFAAKGYIAARLTPKLPADDAAGNGRGDITFGHVRVPVAKDIPAPPGLDIKTLSVYEGKVYFLLPISVAAGASPGERTIELSLVTQACDETSCDPPKTAILKVPISIGSPTDTPAPANPEIFTAAHQQQSVPAPDAPKPAATESAAPAATQNARPPVKLLSPDEQIALINARDYRPYNSEELHYSLWTIILLALAGGAILNVMPCVLPVIPLKALSLVQQAHGDRRLAVMHGLTFSAGVITLFVALAIVLRTFGLFYGQQFQSAGFLITMTYFVVALSLSMLGVWTINPPQVVYAVDAKLSEAGQESYPLGYASPTTKTATNHSRAYLGSFGSGLMATVLATPCSAPFLGGVLAWALIQPTWIAALTLGLVGVGMSLPYLLLAAFPSLLSRFPRAGRWSELLKQGLGIVMLGVAVYLITLIPNVQLWTWVMIGGVVVGLVCWAWGQIPSPQMSSGRTWTIRAIAVVLGVALGSGVYALGSRTNRIMASIQTEGAWQPFNIALLDAALAEGRPVVVDWTANWCINCRVLEATVLSKQSVQDAFAKSNVLLLRADLSEDNPPATALNRKLGSEAIPVLAIFSPQHPVEPVVLRDSYSPERVTDEVSKAK